MAKEQFVVIITVLADGRVECCDPNGDGLGRLNLNHDLMAQGWTIDSINDLTPSASDQDGAVRFAKMLVLEKHGPTGGE